jgi:hypothetical protein
VPDLAHVTKVLAARAEHYDRTASFPADSIAAVQDAGLLITAMTMFAHALQGIEPTWPDGIYTAAAAEAAQRPVLVNALRVEPELRTPARGGRDVMPQRGRSRGWPGGPYGWRQPACR